MKLTICPTESLTTTGTFLGPPREHQVTSLNTLPGIFSLSHIRPSSFPQTHQLSPPVMFLLLCLHGWFLCLHRSWLLREASASPPNVSLFPYFLPFYGTSHYLVCPSVPWKTCTLPRISLIIRMSRSPKICLRDAQNGVSHGEDRARTK